MHWLMVIDTDAGGGQEAWGAARAMEGVDAVTVLAVGASPLKVSATPRLQAVFRTRDRSPLAVAARAQEVVGLTAPEVVIWPFTTVAGLAGDYFAQALNGDRLAGVTGIEIDNGGITARVLIFGGRVEARVGSRKPGPLSVTFRPKVFTSDDLVEHQGEESQITGTAVADPQSRLSLREGLAFSSHALETARLVVSGGRGVGGPEGFTLLAQLAEALPAEVGASRAAVDAGWIDPSRQVGQTGVTVTPDVYLAVGISGASQHLAGMSRAKHVVAINTDPKAPIWRHADVGVVGDYRAVIEGMLAALRGGE